jgi:hypothetical protein
MTIWTDRAQILDRIDKVFFADLRQGLDMMDVDESIRKWAIYGGEVEVAHYACRTMSSDA